jgi:hypothetical protein
MGEYEKIRDERLDVDKARCNKAIEKGLKFRKLIEVDEWKEYAETLKIGEENALKSFSYHKEKDDELIRKQERYITIKEIRELTDYYIKEGEKAALEKDEIVHKPDTYYGRNKHKYN